MSNTLSVPAVCRQSVPVDPNSLGPLGAAPPTSIPCAFACRELNGDSYLLLVSLSASDAGDVALEKMRNQYRNLMPNGWARRITSGFTKDVLGTGIVDISLAGEPQIVLSPDRAYRRRVRLHVRDYSHNILLTDAFLDPGLLRHIADFAEHAYSDTHGSVEVSRDPCWLEVIVISRVMDQHRVVLGFLSILFVTIVVGIVAGASLRRPDVGIGIASSGFALVNALQSLIAYIDNK